MERQGHLSEAETKNWCWGEKEDEKGACSRRTPPNHVSYDGIYLLRDLWRGHEMK